MNDKIELPSFPQNSGAIIDRLYNLDFDSLIKLLEEYNKSFSMLGGFSFRDFQISINSTIREEEKGVSVRCTYIVFKEGMQVASEERVNFVTIFVKIVKADLIYITAMDNLIFPDFSKLVSMI